MTEAGVEVREIYIAANMLLYLVVNSFCEGQCLSLLFKELYFAPPP